MEFCAGKWKGTTVAVKILEHSAESSSGLKELRESVLSSSIIHPNVVSTYKIRTLPAAARKPLPQVQPGCCVHSLCLAAPLTLRLSHIAGHCLTAAGIPLKPSKGIILMLLPSAISSHVMIQQICDNCCTRGLVLVFWMSQTAERHTLGRLRDLAMPGG